ncbi:MAG: FAD-dependent oxidoreductase, partial [Verrucomicrobiales bacterium]
FYQRHETVRFLVSELERTRWEKRLGDAVFENELMQGVPDLPGSLFHPPLHGVFRMRRSGFLRVNAWLEASKVWFREQGLYEYERALLPEECKPDGDTLWVFANGPWLLGLKAFDWLPMRYAHGDILTLSIPDLGEDARIFNGAGWLLPLGDGLWRAGSTYEALPRPETVPSAEGRSKIETNVRVFLRCPYTVEEHVAAVRPVTLTRFPTMGRHPGKSYLAWFGGFSSKAVLTSPSYAQCFLNYVLDGKPLPAEVDAP